MAEASTAVGERPSIVTTKKEKDPRRVKAGKALAKISREAKERKKEREEKLKKEETDSWTIFDLGSC